MLGLTVIMSNEKMNVHLSWGCRKQIQTYCPYDEVEVLNGIANLMQRPDSAEYLLLEVKIGETAVVLDEGNQYMFLAEMSEHDIIITALYYYGEDAPYAAQARYIKDEQPCILYLNGQPKAEYMSGLLFKQLTA